MVLQGLKDNNIPVFAASGDDGARDMGQVMPQQAEPGNRACPGVSLCLVQSALKYVGEGVQWSPPCFLVWRPRSSLSNII